MSTPEDDIKQLESIRDTAIDHLVEGRGLIGVGMGGDSITRLLEGILTLEIERFCIDYGLSMPEIREFRSMEEAAGDQATDSPSPTSSEPGTVTESPAPVATTPTEGP